MNPNQIESADSSEIRLQQPRSYPNRKTLRRILAVLVCCYAVIGAGYTIAVTLLPIFGHSFPVLSPVFSLFLFLPVPTVVFMGIYYIATGFEDTYV